MPIQEVNAAEFKTLVNAEQPVLVKFGAPWCGPCKMIEPVLVGLAEERPDVKFVQVNVDKERELAAAYGLRSVPTLILFAAGTSLAKHTGAATKAQIEALLEGLA